MNSKTTSLTSSKPLGGKVIVILGPTGSGKTGVSIKIAKEIGGEIISADSRAIYKGMDIGTAKPSVAEQDGVPHFGLDLVEPGERFTVADWKEYALQKISEIQARGHVPIICGGTGLYIDALVYDYQFGSRSAFLPPRSSRSSSSEPNYPSDREELCSNYLLIGVKWPQDQLDARLRQRIEQMFCPELYEETRFLVNKYGWESQAMKSNIYSFAWRYLNNEISLDEAKKLCFYDDRHLAKRQMTWFKRTPEILWMELEKIYPFVLEYIQNEQGK